jgi:hypothetical protein
MTAPGWQGCSDWLQLSSIPRHAIQGVAGFAINKAVPARIRGVGKFLQLCSWGSSPGEPRGNKVLLPVASGQ